MTGTIRQLLMLSFACAPLLAHAQIYLCKDASGRTITSDRPIPECADRAMREYGKNGAVKRDIPAPMTAEEKRQKQLQEDKVKAQANAADEQKRNDRAMLARYLREEDIEMERKRSLDAAQEQLKRGNAALASAEKQLKQAQAEMAASKQKQPTPPAVLRHKLEQAEQSVSNETRAVRDNETEIVQIDAKFVQTLKRFREVNKNAPK